MNTRKNIGYLTFSALIGALYTSLSLISGAFGLASGPVQLRVSEALCVLPAFTPAAVPGLTVGCFIYNLFFSGNILDTIFGTLATFIGASLALLFKKRKYLSFIPSFLSNTLIIPLVLYFSFSPGTEFSLPYLFLTVGAGEILSCGLLGVLLVFGLNKHPEIFKK